MSNETNKLLSAATGMGASALWWFSVNEQDRNDRIRNLRFDQRDTNDRLNEHLTSGDWYRLTTPAVRDLIAGYSTANPLRAQATSIPSPTTQMRPDWSQGGNIPNLTWPPTTATYNDAGNPLSWGELATAGQVQTFEEPRAWLQGLTLSSAPGADSKLQIFFAAQALVQVLRDLRLPLSDYKAAWTELFQGALPAPTALLHMDPAAPPSVTNLNAGVSSAVALNSANVSGAYNNPNTDTAMRFRVTTNSSGVGAGNTVFTVNFGKEYKWSAGALATPFQPVVVPNGPLFYAYNITSTGFEVRTFNNLGANSTYDVFISVNAGVQTVA